MKKRKCFSLLIMILLLTWALYACSGSQISGSSNFDNQTENDDVSIEFEESKETEESIVHSKSCIVKWYTEFNYTGDNNGEPEVFLYANVRDDGTYDLRWLEPEDPEDVTETFEYELVQSPQQIIESFFQLYYDEKTDRLTLSADGLIVTLDRDDS